MKLKEYDEVENLTHKLKGVAGNLGMPEVSKLAAELNYSLKTETDGAGLQEAGARLENELKQALSSIELYLAMPNETVLPVQRNETPFEVSEKLTAQLEELFHKLDADNPNDVKPLLATLENQFGKAFVHLIVEAVDEFDFSRARVETEKLIKKIGA